MYLEHFGLYEAPFRITPHTDFFFAGANRGATLEALIYAITHDEGIVRVSGEVGSGKTMLCRVLMERLPERVETAYIANPTLSSEDILYALADELHVKLPAERPNALLRALQEHLIARHTAGRQVVVLVDEAHAMPAATLEQIRLLSNLETKRSKLLQIVLFGQPELEQTLGRAEMRQLKDRITHHFRLEPLVRTDVAAYLEFRMRAAGYRGPSVFDDDAVRLIAGASGGLTRRINVLADKALLAAFARNTHHVQSTHAQAAIRDADLTQPSARPNVGAAVTAVLLIALAGAGVWWVRARPVSSPAPETTVAPLVRPAAPLPTLPREASPVTPPTTAPPATPPTSAPAPASAAPAAAPQTPAERAETAPRAILTGVGPRTSQLLLRTEDWLASASDEHWFLQLLTAEAGQAEEVERFVAAIGELAEPQQLRVYQARVGAGQRMGVIYGDYASLAQANAALARLPPALRAYGAFPRQVRRLKP